MPPLRIATRQSPLAFAQSRSVAALLQARHGIEVELVTVLSQGDRDRISPLSQAGGIGLFTKEVNAAVADGRADLAVHSAKDLPAADETGLILAAVPERAPDHDVLAFAGEIAPDPFGRAHANEPAQPTRAPAHREQEQAQTALAWIPYGATVGTGSPRRAAQLLRLRPDLGIAPVRGNVETRLQKARDEGWCGVVLAEAGLRRLDQDVTRRELPILPAAGQGALALVCRRDDAETRDSLQAISHPASALRVALERSLLRTMKAGCHVPAGCRTRVVNDRITAEAALFAPDGSTAIESRIEGPAAASEALGAELANDLLARGGARLLHPEGRTT